MNFSPTEEQEALQGLAAQIFSDAVSHERSKELESDGSFYDESLWASATEAGLTGIALPEESGGAGLGMAELCAVFEEQGRYLAPIPLLPTTVAALAIAKYASAEQAKRWLSPVVESAGVLSYAVAEVGGIQRPRAETDGEGWKLSGARSCVAGAARADCILLAAEDGEGATRLFVVPRESEGLSIETQRATNHEPLGHVRFDAVRIGADAEIAPGRGEAALREITDIAQLLMSATQIGVADEAMKRTARYLSERKQFGRPLGSFQGPQLRTADAYIDVQAIRAVVMLAAWRHDERMPSSEQIAVAKWWSARAGDRVVHTAMHLHGGIGADTDYPIHRFFLWAEQLANSLGGANETLARLGEMLVSEERAPA